MIVLSMEPVLSRVQQIERFIKHGKDIYMWGMKPGLSTLFYSAAKREAQTSV